MSTKIDVADHRLQAVAEAARKAAARNGVTVEAVEFRRDTLTWRHLIMISGRWNCDHGVRAAATLSVNQEALEDYGADWCFDQIMEVMPALFRSNQCTEGRLIPGGPVICHA